jgi:hypothetical protein
MSDENKPKDVTELITLLRIDIALLMQKVDSFHNVERKVDDIAIIADRATQSTSSAHKRIDRIETESTSGRRWAIGSVLTSIAVAVSVISLFLNLK